LQTLNFSVFIALSVALATYISLASHTTPLAKPHSQCDIEPSQAGLYIARVIQGWLCTWAVLSKLRPI
jgi:hypothetical protein